MNNEKQRLVFTAANENLGLAFRKTGGSTLSATWYPGASNSSLVTLLESLYGSGNVAISGTLTPTGTVGDRTYSGTLTIDFGGDLAATDVEQVEVRTGPVYNYVVSGGDSDSDYSADGGTTFSLGISKANFQINQRAIGGAHAAVVCVGSSTAVSSTGGRVSTGTNPNISQTPTVIDMGSLLTLTRVEANTGGGSSGAYTVLKGSTDNVTFSTLYTTGDGSIGCDITVPGDKQGPWRYFSLETTSSGDSYNTAGGLFYTTPAVSVPGDANFKTYFPPDVTPSAPSSTGTGASNTISVAKGASATVVPNTAKQGNPLLTSNLDYNLIAEDTEGETLDFGSAGSTGWTAILQVAESTDTDAILSAVIKGSTTGTFGGEETVTCSFDDLSDRGGQVICSASETSVLKRYQRVELSVVGDDPGFAVHAAIAKGRAAVND